MFPGSFSKCACATVCTSVLLASCCLLDYRPTDALWFVDWGLLSVGAWCTYLQD